MSVLKAKPKLKFLPELKLLADSDLKNPEWVFQGNYLVDSPFNRLLAEKFAFAAEVGCHPQLRPTSDKTIHAVYIYREPKGYVRPVVGSQVGVYAGLVWAVYTKFRQRKVEIPSQFF